MCDYVIKRRTSGLPQTVKQESDKESSLATTKAEKLRVVSSICQIVVITAGSGQSAGKDAVIKF